MRGRSPRQWHSLVEENEAGKTDEGRERWKVNDKGRDKSKYKRKAEIYVYRVSKLIGLWLSLRPLSRRMILQVIMATETLVGFRKLPCQHDVNPRDFIDDTGVFTVSSYSRASHVNFKDCPDTSA